MSERSPSGRIVLPAAPSPTSPWALLFGAVLASRRRRAVARARRLPAPVVSIGNLQMGGSGKTPLVASIAAHLDARGHRVAVLSRGYGRSTRGVRIASRGYGAEANASEVGDEPRLLAELLPGVAVVVGEDRYEAGRHALHALDPAPDVFVLDDGFSHLQLARDVDLLAFPSASPWGNGRLLPFGNLREPLAAARAAHAVILTGVEPPLDGAALPLAAALAPFGFAGPAFAAGSSATLEPPPPQPGMGQPPPPQPGMGQPPPPQPGMGHPQPASPRVVLATGIARPERAAASARGLGLEVLEHLVFPDHHPFPRRSLDRIERAVATTGADALVVTAKDRVKIEGRIDAPLYELRVTAELETAFWGFLDRALERALGR